jgi:hypothetical protein
MTTKIVLNFLTNTYHKVESFFSSGDENVVFTEDSKCFPINENITIIDSKILSKCLININLKNILPGKFILNSMIDPNTGKKIKI